MTAVIVEDEVIVADHLSMLLKSEGIEVLAIASDLDGALKSIDLQPDFYFLDIRLDNNESGLEFGSTLNEKNIPFIYITANNEDEVLKKAVETQPQHYITKPFKDRDVIAAIQIAKIKAAKESIIMMQTLKGREPIKLNGLLYCEVDGVYSTCVTEQKDYHTRNSLTQLKTILPDNFIRVHRSFIVNKDKLEVVTGTYVQIGEKRIPVSRSYKSEIKDLT
jgi:two-component system response regulator LytT